MREIADAAKGFVLVDTASEAEVIVFDLDQPPRDWANYLKNRLGVGSPPPKLCLVLQMSIARDAKTKLITDQIKVIFGSTAQFCSELPKLSDHLEWVRTKAASIRDMARQIAVAASKTQPRLFVSYHHGDRGWLEKLKTMFAPVGCDIDFWDDSLIKPGQDWKGEIQMALEVCSAGLLLVSPDFLASDFIQNQELPALLKGARGGTLKVLWIAVRDSVYEQTSIGRYQALNDPGQPLESLSESEQSAAMKKIVLKIWNELGSTRA